MPNMSLSARQYLALWFPHYVPPSTPNTVQPKLVRSDVDADPIDGVNRSIQVH